MATKKKPSQVIANAVEIVLYIRTFEFFSQNCYFCYYCYLALLYFIVTSVIIKMAPTLLAWVVQLSQAKYRCLSRLAASNE